MNDRSDYPTMRGPSPDASGAVLTREVMERVLCDVFDKSKQAEREKFAEVQRKASVEHAKATYAQYLGVTELSPEQEKEMWDGISDAWWRYMCRTTNIIEWLED